MSAITTLTTLNYGTRARAIVGVLAGLCLLLLLPRVILCLQTGLTFLAWPWQFDYTEGVNLSAVTQLAAGVNIYRPSGPDAFISVPYTPLFFLVNAPFTWLTGPSFMPGRAISLLCTLVVAALLAYMVWRATSYWTLGLLSGALWLSLSPVIVWAALYEQNMPALAFSLGGLVWTYTHPRDRGMYVGVILFALAFFTKQSALDAVAATTVWLLLRDWRGGLRFGLALGAAISVPFFAIDLLLKGGLWEHAVRNHTQYDWAERRFVRATNRLWGEYWPLILLAVAGLAVTITQLVRNKGNTTEGKDGHSVQGKGRMAALTGAWGLALIYALIGGASVLSRVGREGINYNHLLDVLLPLCLLFGLSAGILAGRVAQELGAGKPLSIAALGFALTLAALVAQVFSLVDAKAWYHGPWPGPDLHRQMTNLSGIVARTEGDIFSEDAYLLISNGRRAIFDDPYMFVALAKRGRWDDSVFMRSMRDRRFSLILLQQDTVRWTDAGLVALQQNYTLQHPDQIDLYVPKGTPDAPQYGLKCNLAGEGDTLMLEGYSLAPGVGWHGIGGGEILRVTLHWRAEIRPEGSYASFVHVINEKNERVAGQDNPQTGATQPTAAWEPGKAITDTASIPLPANLEPGRYRLVAGAYRQEGGAIKSLVPSCQEGETFGEAVLLGWVEVK